MKHKDLGLITQPGMKTPPSDIAKFVGYSEYLREDQPRKVNWWLVILIVAAVIGAGVMA